jgi:hypothetical protein
MTHLGRYLKAIPEMAEGAEIECGLRDRHDTRRKCQVPPSPAFAESAQTVSRWVIRRYTWWTSLSMKNLGSVGFTPSRYDHNVLFGGYQ